MKARLFIGSSVESLNISYAIQEELEYDAEVTVWSQGIFELTGSTLGSLIAAARSFDAAVFVFAPDDIAKIHDSEVSVPRDNVILEIGLFMGILGTDRVYFVVPRDTPRLRLPTDLLGITPATFAPNRSDDNMRAALGPACNKIRSQLRSLMSRAAPKPPVERPPLTDDEAIAVIKMWLERAMADVLLRPHAHAELDELLELPRGTSARLTGRAAAASPRGIRVLVDNGHMIQLQFEA